MTTDGITESKTKARIVDNDQQEPEEPIFSDEDGIREASEFSEGITESRPDGSEKTPLWRIGYNRVPGFDPPIRAEFSRNSYIPYLTSGQGGIVAARKVSSGEYLSREDVLDLGDDVPNCVFYVRGSGSYVKVWGADIAIPDDIDDGITESKMSRKTQHEESSDEMTTPSAEPGFSEEDGITEA